MVRQIVTTVLAPIRWMWGHPSAEQYQAKQREEIRRRIVASRPITVSAEPTSCPRCGYEKIATIVYGLPAMGRDGQMKQSLRERVGSGEISLGGCVMDLNSPQWCCKACKAEFVQGESRDCG